MSARWQQMILAAVLSALAVCAAAQLPPTGTTSGSLGNAHTYEHPEPLTPYDPTLSHRQFLARRVELHNRMLDNATKLLALTRELQESIHLHDPNAGDARSLDDIAKLARAVRDQMRQ